MLQLIQSVVISAVIITDVKQLLQVIEYTIVKVKVEVTFYIVIIIEELIPLEFSVMKLIS